MPIHWDDIELLRALDGLERDGRAHHISGEDLIVAVADGQPCGDQDRVAFVRILRLMRERGRLVFEQQNYLGARQPQPQEHEYLQSLWHFQLTESGRDRARGRVVQERLADPDEDDGPAIPGLVLERVAQIIADWYTLAQLPKFFDDSGLPQNPFDSPPQAITKHKYAFNLLAILESSDSEQLRVLRRFLAAFLNGALATPHQGSAGGKRQL